MYTYFRASICSLVTMTTEHSIGNLELKDSIQKCLNPIRVN